MVHHWSRWRRLQAAAAFVAATVASAQAASAPALSGPKIQTLSLPASGRHGPLEWRGSGFYVNDQGAVVTAAHVVQDCAQPVLIKDGLQIRPTELRLERELDVAILETPRIHGVAAVLGEQPPASFGVYVASFVDLLQTPARNSVLTNAMIVDGDRLAAGARRGQFAMVSLAQPGASGSAVMDSDGRVVGMIESRTAPSAEAGDLSRSTFATGLASLTTVLTAAHVPFRQSREAQLEPEQSRRDRAAGFTLGVYCQR